MSDQNPNSRASSVSSESDSLGFFYRVRPTSPLQEIELLSFHEKTTDISIPESLFWIFQNMEIGDNLLFSVEKKQGGLEFLAKSMSKIGDVKSMSGSRCI